MDEKHILKTTKLKLNFMKKIIKNKFLFFFLGIMFSMQAQESTVKGVITDANIGSPLPGASDLVKGKAVGVTTDVDGA